MDEASFIRIAPGEYDIGLAPDAARDIVGHYSIAPLKDEFIYNSVPRHRLFISEVFISRRLVTLEDYRKFTCATGYVSEAEKDRWGWIWDKGWKKIDGVSYLGPFSGPADRLYHEYSGLMPVMQVSWNDAIAYCGWLSEVTGRMVRLPSEPEWEIFALHNEVKNITEKVKEKLEYIENSIEFLQEIIRIVNEQGGDHPCGMVWEWAMNWFTGYPGGKQNKEFGEVYKSLRGGSLLSRNIQRGREYRFRRCPTARSPYYGFRTALAPDET